MTNIFVGNLSYQASEADIRDAFKRHGDVASVKIITDRATGRSRGFGFVLMPKLEDAEEAILRLNGASICGREVVVNEALEKSTRPIEFNECRWDSIRP